MNELRRYAATILAVLTALADIGHMAHWYNQEWIVLLLAILTVVATFVPPALVEVMPAPEVGTTAGKKGGPK
jgi:uncharacterized membrane protein YhaH (DUF805 family)